METLETPQILSEPIATSGQKNAIPDAPTGTAHASVQEGFPPVTMLKQEDGGEAPYGQDFNGMFNLLSQFYFFVQAGGMYTFDEEVSEKIGGYPLNARLFYVDGNGAGTLLRSAKPNNTDNFITNPEVIGTSWLIETTGEKYIDDNFVSIATDQTITGHKRIANNGDTPFVSHGQQNSQLDIQATNVDTSNLPTSGNVYGGLTFIDKNDLRIGKVETSLSNAGTAQTVISTSLFNGSAYVYASMGPSVTSSYKKIYNFGQGGNNSSYFKIPLGGSSSQFLTICWGSCTPGSSSAGSTVNFPVAYASTPRVTVSLVNAGDAGYVAYVWSRTTTGFSAARHGGSGSADWIAVGISN